jgi:phage/plasmid-like protein (TIGR03299 family)
MATTITREATWNKVGTDIREANSVKEALQISGLDYEVVKAPIYLSNGHRIKDQFATKKKGTDEVFGIVGKDYTIVQNEEAFSFVDGIISEGLTFVKAGETSYMNYIIASLPEQYILDDKFKPYIIFQNSHAGATTLKAAICPLRIICQNQFTIAFRNSENKISIRHSSSIHEKMDEAQHILQFNAEYMDSFNKMANEMAANKIGDEKALDIIDKYFLVDDNASTRKVNSNEEKKAILLNAYNAEDNQNFRGTQWGLINAFSDYITHLDPARKTNKSNISKFINVTFNNGLMNNFINMVQEYV